DLPGVSREPRVLGDLRADLPRAGRGAETADEKYEAGWVLLRVLVRAEGLDAGSLRRDRMTAGAADEAASAGSFGGIEPRSDVDRTGGRGEAIEEIRAIHALPHRTLRRTTIHARRGSGWHNTRAARASRASGGPGMDHEARPRRRGGFMTIPTKLACLALVV